MVMKTGSFGKSNEYWLLHLLQRTTVPLMHDSMTWSTPRISQVPCDTNVRQLSM